MSKAHAHHDDYLMPKGYSFYLFGLLFLLYLFDYIDRQVIIALFPYLKDPVDGWGLSNAQCGMLVSAVYWSILICTFPVSIIVDRWSRKKSIGIMATFWGLATLACAFTQNFSQLFAARTAIGVGEAGYAPGGTAMISAIFPERIRSLMVGVWNSSIPLGMAMGIVLGGLVAGTFGWRHAFGIVAIPGLIVAILFFFVRDYKTVNLDKSDHPEANLAKQTKAIRQSMSKMDIFRAFAGTPSLLMTYLGFSGMMFLSTSLVTFMPTYFHDIQGLAHDQANLMTSGVLLTAIIGAPLGGFVADRWFRVNPKARLLVPALSAVVSAALYIIGFGFMEKGALQYVVFVVGGGVSIMYTSSAIAVTQDVIHPGLRAMSYALCVITQHMFGSAIGPFATGAWIDAHGVVSALALVPVVAIVSGVIFFIGAQFYERDLAKVAKVRIEAEER